MSDLLQPGLSHRPTYQRVASEDHGTATIELEVLSAAAISADTLPRSESNRLPREGEGQALHVERKRSYFQRPWVKLAASTERFLKRYRVQGWRFGVFVGFYTSAFVLLSNIVLFLLGCFSHGGYIDGIGTLAQGDPDKIQRLSTAYHVLINVLSTILLTSSNYSMQLLCAPTREELDQAHSRGKWMDIGLMSLRNLRHIDAKRLALWLILLLSSVPLHLFYNSAVFEVTAGQDYTIETVNASRFGEHTKGMVRMNNKDWIQTYSTQYVPGYGNLHLVVTALSFDVILYPNWTWSLHSPEANCDWKPWNETSDESTFADVNLQMYANGTVQFSNSTGCRVVVPVEDYEDSAMPVFNFPGPWQVIVNDTKSVMDVINLCPDQSGLRGLVEDASLIAYALSEPTNYSSRVQIALSFMIVVIICNALKTLAIYFTLRQCSSGHVITVGDAVASFLQRPEPDSLGKCTHDKRRYLKDTNHGFGKEEAKDGIWHYRRRHYISFVAAEQWTSNTIVVLASIAPLLALVWAIPSVAEATPYQRGVGRWGTASQLLVPISVSNFDTKGALMNAWLANSPQIVLSFLYFSINRLCTSLCFAKEWNNYAIHRKGLRVTEPSGDQRSTYFLQLPYRWAIPLTFTSGFLHWLLSQSLFLVRFERRKMDGELYPDSTCACGYSPLSILIFTVVFYTLILVVLWLMLATIQIRIPVAAHCSAVISAACHPPPDEIEPHLKAVQWGVVRNRFGGTVNHCTFTSEEVVPPEEGVAYA